MKAKKKKQNGEPRTVLLKVGASVRDEQTNRSIEDVEKDIFTGRQRRWLVRMHMNRMEIA